MEEEEWSTLFVEEKTAQQRLALRVFRDLKEQPVNSSNCATEIPFSPPAETTVSSSVSKNKRKQNHTDNNTATHWIEKFGFF